MGIAAIVGSGLIGQAWAHVFARAGWNVALWDPDADVLAAAPGRIAASLAELARHGLVQDAAGAAARVRVAGSLEDAVRGADLVQENGPERLEVKQDLFARLDEAADDGAILASSSSALVPSRFTEALRGRARCMVAHPVNPPHLVPVVELCGAPWTAADTIARARAIYRSVGQSPVEVRREIDGFVLNRLQAVLLSEAFRLIGEGYVSAEDLDRTVRDGLGRRWAFMGPIETIELNAPAGIPDYCARYGETMHRLSQAPVTPETWSAETCARVARSHGPTPDPQSLAARRDRRDRRLAALAAHLRAAAEEGDG